MSTSKLVRRFWRIPALSAENIALGVLIALILATLIIGIVRVAQRASGKSTLQQIVIVSSAYQEPNDDFFPPFVQQTASSPSVTQNQ